MLDIKRHKTMKNHRSLQPRRLTVCYLISLGLILAGCNGTFQKTDGSQAPIPKLERIAALPMDRASVRPGQERATCSLSDTVFEAHEIPAEAKDRVTAILFELLQNDPRFQIVSEGRCIGFLNSLLVADVKASQLRLIQEFGQELDADAVLYGKLFRYDERVGRRYSVKKPASVAVTLHLIRVKDGAVLWRAAFDETQQPLSENLLKAGLYKKSSMHWLTAEELARLGLNQALGDLKKRLP
jgi:TolB-like protein